MSEMRSRLSALLKSELAQEAEAGFPRLMRLPNTQIIRFLDYFEALSSSEKEALLDAMAHFNAAAFLPELAGAEAVERQQHPVFGRFRKAAAFMGFGGGYRYTPVKLLHGIARDAAVGGLAGWIQKSGFSGLALQAREDLLPNLDCLNPVAPARLRKLVDAVFGKLFAAQKTKVATDHARYTGVLGNSSLKADVLFTPPGKPHPRQLQYFLIIAPGPDFTWSYATYESLWSIPATWDYLTEENAPRSSDALADLVLYLTGLAVRVRQLIKGAS